MVKKDSSLTERVVKEAVEASMDTPLRDPILEAVDESRSTPRWRRIPIFGAILAAGISIGYLIAATTRERVDDAARRVPSRAEEYAEEVEPVEDVTEAVTEDDDSGKRRLPRIVFAVAALGVAAELVRRRLRSGREDWEPIQDFTGEGEIEETDVELDEDDDRDEAIEVDLEAGEMNDDEHDRPEADVERDETTESADSNEE